MPDGARFARCLIFAIGPGTWMVLMPTTLKIVRDDLAAYFDVFTKRFLRDGAPEAADIEVIAPDWGDQYVAEGARLIGITYDARTRTLEFALDSGDHRVREPREVWVTEEPDGFPGTIEIVRPDRTREVITVKKVGLRRIE
ncbi:MAG TPA: DUF5335 family protein [Gemmatimonadaceae bacterium]|nr:DUF5335 family protein [Gemmatimonadaceae bacterium]